MRTGVIATGVCLSVVSLCSAGGAKAAVVRMQTSIPAQALGPALRTFAQTRDLQVLYFSSEVRNLRTSGASGELTADETLSHLLAGTDLTYRYVDGGAVAITPIAGAVPQSSDTAGAAARATAQDSRSTEEGKSQSSPEFRLAEVASGAAGAAAAVGAPPRNTPDPRSLMRLQEVVVTALRRAEAVSNTPAAITALSGDALQQAGVTNAVQLQYVAPGLMVTQTGQGVYLAIRGVTTTDQTSKGEPGILFSVDGIPVGRAEEQALAFFDLQRVEVLSGPQGTLYGKSSTGGAVNVITNAPTWDQSAYADLTVGNYDTKRLEGMIDLPLSDTVAVRFSAASNARKGYVTLLGGGGENNGGDKPGDENDVTGRLSLLAKLGDGARLRLTGMTGRIDSVGFGDGDASMNCDRNDECEGTTVAAWNPIPGHVEDNFAQGTAQLDVPIGAVHMTYLGSTDHYRTANLQSSYLFGAQGTDNGEPLVFGNGVAADGDRLLVRDSYDTIYQELRLSNQEAERLQWILGLNYWYEGVQENGHGWELANDITSPALSTNDLLPIYQANGWDPSYESLFNLLNHTVHNSFSAYAHGVYSLTRNWNLTVGLREEADRISRVGTIAPGPFQFGPPGVPWSTPSGGLCVGDSECVGAIPNYGHGSSHKLVWNLGTDYHFTPDQMGYVTVATGYKAGGFNDAAPPAGKFAPYAPEEMIAYEAGYKLHAAASLDFTSSLYYYDYSNEQINTGFLVGGNVYTLTVGVPTHLYGLENTLKWAFSPSDIIDLQADFEKSRYIDFSYISSLSIPVDLTGKSLDLVPEYVAMLGYTHRWNLPDDAVLQFHARSRWSASYDVTDFNGGIQYRQKPFSRSDADLTYITGNGKLATELFVTNIENKVQITGGPVAYPAGTQFPAGYSASGYAEISQPRFWGIRETLRF